MISAVNLILGGLLVRRGRTYGRYERRWCLESRVRLSVACAVHEVGYNALEDEERGGGGCSRVV